MHKGTRTTNRCIAWLLKSALVVGVLFHGACSKPQPKKPRHEVFPTKGTLTYNGQPLKGATVTFWPLFGEGEMWRRLKPQAVVEADGSFAPNSYDIKDGAPAGEYAVTVMWTGERNGPGPDLLGGRFNNSQYPVMKVTITKGENLLPPITLRGPAIHPAAAKAAQVNIEER